MTKLNVEFKNCYGINKLDYTFDFSSRKIYLIYALNGVMKTSFVKAFKNLSKGIESKDLIFPEKVNFIRLEAYSKQSLWNMRQFYNSFPILPAVRRELSWSHYKLHGVFEH